MDFSFTSEQDAAAELARRICADRTLAAAGPDAGPDRTLWRQLGEAGLLSLHVAEPHGDGIGMIAACRVLVELGRAVAPVPAIGQVVASAILAEMLAAGDDPSGLGDLLGELATGAQIAALVVAGGPGGSGVRARPDGDVWVLDGEASMVEYGMQADQLLITASGPDGPMVLLVGDPEAGRAGAGATGIQVPGVEVRAQQMSGSHPVAEVVFQAAPARRVGAAQTAARLRHAHLLVTAAVQLGTTERALELTAEHTRNRHQFGQPLGSFQAVSQRLGDGWIDLACQRLSLWQAAWRWEAGEPLEPAIEVAAFWAAEGGHRVTHSAIHLHGGAGVDLDGPVHPYFTAAKRQEFMVGGVTRQALAIGRWLARDGADV